MLLSYASVGNLLIDDVWEMEFEFYISVWALFSTVLIHFFWSRLVVNINKVMCLGRHIINGLGFNYQLGSCVLCIRVESQLKGGYQAT